jgi:hypothetical protein
MHPRKHQQRGLPSLRKPPQPKASNPAAGQPGQFKAGHDLGRRRFASCHLIVLFALANNLRPEKAAAPETAIGAYYHAPLKPQLGQFFPREPCTARPMRQEPAGTSASTKATTPKRPAQNGQKQRW